MGYIIINLKDIYDSIGEKKTKEKLKEFECDQNKDVEYFIREKAIEFSKQLIAETFIVMAEYKGENVIVGYFSITNKSIIIRKTLLSNSKRKALIKYARYDQEAKGYQMALPLIGQLGKNFRNGYNNLITGDELLKLACDKIKVALEVLGGKFIYLECEDKEVLREFYESNGFVCFSKRNLEKDEKDKNSGDYLLQMICDISKN